MTSSALCFVFDIPEAIEGYNEAINQVFGEVSSALSQFQIYQSMDNINPLLFQQIHLVMVKFVEVCAHVIKYRQGHMWDRLKRQIKSNFDDDSGLEKARTNFREALKQKGDIEGTITLAIMVETRKDLTKHFEDLGKKVEETQKGIQSLKESTDDMKKAVQSLTENTDRTKTLIKIRNALDVPVTVHLDAKTTQTCQNIVDKCLDGTGTWIWTHDAYTTWTAPKDKHVSHVLLVSGPPSSGKTSATALIIKRLEEQKDRTYVAHYFFPATSSVANTRRFDSGKSTVQSALKYMAFQLARVDETVRKALGKSCDTGFRSSSSTNLDSLWGELMIGAPGSKAMYYLVFDGVENLPEKQAGMLLKFLSSPGLTGESIGRVRVLVSGTNNTFNDVRGALRIQMEKHNRQDMRIIVDGKLNERTVLQHTKPNSVQQKARKMIVEKLPQKVEGSYSQLQFGLEEVFRLLSTRTGLKDLDQLLDRLISNHELAIKNLQRSLTVNEISELNELLKWVLFNVEGAMTLGQLEAAMVSPALWHCVDLAAKANGQREAPIFRYRVTCFPARHYEGQVLDRAQG